MIRFKSVLQQDCLIGYANPARTLVNSFVLVKFNPYRLAVALSVIHCMSLRSGSLIAWALLSFTIFLFVAASIHRWISPWPSAKPRPAAPLW